MQQLSTIFSSPFNGIRRGEKKHLNGEMSKLSTPPACMFSPSKNDPSPTSVMNQAFGQLGMHEVRLDNFQDDFLPSPENLQIYHVRNKMMMPKDKRWFRNLFIVILFLTIFISLLAVVLFARSDGRATETNKATGANDVGWQEPLGFLPIDSRLKETIKFLLDDVDHKLLTDTKAPQFQAAQWMADIDMHKISLDTPLLFKQRYTLALFWFATSGEYWNQSVNFLTDAHECDWKVPYQRLDRSVFDMGVQCNAIKEVTGLILQGMNLTGRIPREIRMLSKLEQLSLDHNNVTDFESFRRLTSLTRLSVGYNKFSTWMPEWIGELSNLRTLSLSASGFESTLPTQLRKLTELSTFAVDNNKMTGTLDALEDMPWLVNVYLKDNAFTGNITDTFLQDLKIVEVLDLSKNQFRGLLERGFMRNRPRLQILDLHNNYLDGPLPDMPRSSSLKFLDLQDNLFEGSIPPSIDSLSTLKHFDISNNRLSGDIPVKHLSKLTQLEYLSFHSNNFLTPGSIPDLSMLSNLKELNMMNTARTGILPSWLGELTKLVLLDLQSNRLNSTIPSELNHLSDLKFLLLNDNKLNGNIPNKLGTISKLEILLLDKNDLTGQTDTLCNLTDKPVIIADCETELSCNCCSLCCSDDQPKKCYDKGWLSFHASDWEDHYSMNVLDYGAKQLIIP